MHAKSETLNCVKHQQNTAWAHVFLMLARATSIKNRAKIDEKLHDFGNINFGWILEEFGEAKIYDFRNFFDVFSKSFLKHTRGEQKN